METPSLGEDTPFGASLRPEPCLCLVVCGDAPTQEPQRWSLADLDGVTIGRADRLDVRRTERKLHLGILDRHVSTEHLALVRRGDTWSLEDAGSKNGTLLNGERCVRANLDDGDVFALGATLFAFDATGGTIAHEPVTPAFATLVPFVAAIYARLATVAASDLPIVLLGETGVGKEVTARAVHDLSKRGGAFVGVNCGALSPSLLEATLFGHRRGAFTGAVDSRPGLVRSADRGTLFLDEVGELSPAAQVALLRVLQEREVVPVGESEPIGVDTRVIAATHRDLVLDVEEGRFRRDLYARLAGMSARLAPLRERRNDLGLLVGAILARVAPPTSLASVQLTARAARALFEHAWPQNIRELEMCIRSAGALAAWGKIDIHHLPPEIMREREAALAGNGRANDRESLVALMRAHDGNVAAVARALKTSRTQVHRMLKRHAIAIEDFRG